MPSRKWAKRAFSYVRMNGVGNRFLIIDARQHELFLFKSRILRFTNPSYGYGCDQLIVLEPSPAARHPSAFMRIYNADGSESGACGNATRCVAWLLARESGKETVEVQTRAGMLECAVRGDTVTVNMGLPRFGREGMAVEGLQDGMEVNMGNPHVVFFVEDIGNIDLGALGPRIERRTDLFPERVNVSVAQVVNGEHITLRVWERGAGLTKACGTAACATLAAAARRGLSARKADIRMPGGTLHVEWYDNGNLHMTGPVEEEFRGEVTL